MPCLADLVVSATCEKQIIVPNNSVLYCSERYGPHVPLLPHHRRAHVPHSCRKKDNEKTLSFQTEHSPPPTPFSNFSNLSFEDLHFRDIVPPRSPTAPRSQRSSCAFSELSYDDNAGSNDDKSAAMESDASRYLRLFQSTSAASASETTTVRPSRPR